jgi:hypothetical protein
MTSRLWVIVAAVLVTGCAHRITLVPDAAQVPRTIESRIGKNAAYYIAKEDRDREVTTPGGGGDKVTYLPVRDLEYGLFRLLSNVFDRVYTLPALDDAAFLASRNIAFVFEPKITTESSSRNVLIWPPTHFTVSIACRAYDPQRKLVWEKTVVGEGVASAGELTKDFALAGNRAAGDALRRLQEALVNEPVFRQ